MKRIVVYALVLNAALLAGCRHVASSRQPAAPPSEVDVAEELVDPERRGRQLRGEYGRYRANNDLLYYHLDIRVTPETRSIRGKNTIRFRMLRDDNRIQLDLNRDLSIDKILLGPKPLQYTRELNAVFVDFPTGLKSGREYSIDFYYSGAPKRIGRFGGISFDTDPAGRPWIYTACEGPGSSYWWPGKDQWRDEVESMDISVAVPNQLMNVSNGRFVGKKDLADGYTRWDWRVHYPINSYNVSLNIAAYKHFSDRLGKLSLDFYSLPEDLERAKKQFAQAKPMLKAFKHYFGDYPFIKDGYKIIQVPYSGMEHQTAVTYGNGFTNGYLNKDWTGVGVSMKLDFIIIHESAHEWFGNAVTASDVCDMWIHEGWATYLECMYVERMFGYADALKYVNGYKSKVRNKRPVIAERGIHQSPPGDQYFKGALFLNTLRNVLNDDRKWWALVREVYQDFKYQSIRTEDLVRLFNKRFEAELTPIFDQYLRHAALPVLELVFDEAAGSVEYRWKADEADFAMPIRVGKPKEWQTITPTVQWQTLSTRLGKEAFKVATDLYFVKITKSLREDEGAK